MRGTTATRLHPGDLRLIRFIDGYQQKFRYPPTYRQIAAAMDWSSSSSAQSALDRLQRYGWVEREEGQPRTLRLTAAALREVGRAG